MVALLSQMLMNLLIVQVPMTAGFDSVLTLKSNTPLHPFSQFYLMPIIYTLFLKIVLYWGQCFEHCIFYEHVKYAATECF